MVSGDSAMTVPCIYCGMANDPSHKHCQRCGALLPVSVEIPQADLERDETPCPSCKAINTLSAEYCTSCGTPMAVVTRVVELHSRNERGPLETWRVYGIETRMVARHDEQAALFDLHKQSIQTNAPLFVGLKARAGLGKSRLLAEFRHKLDERFSEAVVLQAECRDVTSGPFSMFARLFKERFYIAEHEPPAVARRKLQEAVEALLGRSPETVRISHLMGHLLDLPFDEELRTTSDIDTTTLDRRSFDAVVQILTADASRSPLILMLEDVQIAPEPTLNLLKYLRKSLSEAPVMIIAAWNPQELPSSSPLEELGFDRTIELQQLSDEDVDAFVRQTLHKAEEIPPVLVEKIVESAHGNPLAVEEMLRLLIAEGTIDTRQSTWIIHANKIKKLKLPSTVEEAVRARLNALSEDERTFLAMASCVGDAFWPELMVSLMRMHKNAQRSGALGDHWQDEREPEQLRELLESLERKDMIRRREDTMLPGIQELYFKHRLERKSIYQTLSGQLKQRYHRIIAQWLEQREQSLSERMAEFIGWHYDQARCLELAAKRYIEAAQYAKQRYANRKAIELYTRGLSYLSDADMHVKIRAFHDLGSVYDLLGEYDQALAYYREMLRYAWLLNDINKGGAALNKIGRAYRSLGEFEGALSCLSKALELFQEVKDTPGIASTLDDIGKVHWIRGRMEESLHHYDSALALRRELGDERSIALSLNHIGTLHLQRGSFREAMIYLREALELRRKIDDRQGVAESFNNLGILCMERGELDQSITLFKEALEVVQEIGYRALEGMLLNNLGESWLLKGDLTKAAPLLEQSLQVSEESGERRIIFDVLRNLGKISLKRGDRAQAITYMDEALDIAEELDSHTLQGLGYQNMADIHAHFVFDPEYGEESKQQADAYYRDGIELLKSSGSESQLGHCLSSYGNFLLEQNQIIQGKKQLELASEIFKRLEMRKFLDQTEQLIGEL